MIGSKVVVDFCHAYLIGFGGTGNPLRVEKECSCAYIYIYIYIYTEKTGNRTCVYKLDRLIPGNGACNIQNNVW